MIRRVVSGSSDSFYVNNKLYTKARFVSLFNNVQSEMESFLETAGFSRDNPYYMVEQGSVKQICELSDAGRLRLLKEVAGTRVYEDRRRESEAVLEDTKQKVDQVNDLINDMKASLSVRCLRQRDSSCRSWRKRRTCWRSICSTIASVASASTSSPRRISAKRKKKSAHFLASP